jgi:hypothetical protein
MFEKQLPFLRPGELPGPKYWNSVIRFLRRIASRSSRLVLNERPGGGFYLDLADADQAASAAMDISFKGTVSSGNVVISAGSVRLPDATLSVSSSTISASGTKCIFVRVTHGAASIQSDSSFPQLVDKYNQRLNIPLGVCSSGTYTHRHVGDIIIPNMPYFWISNFTANAAQSLDHDINGDLIWTTYGDCPAAEE